MTVGNGEDWDISEIRSDEGRALKQVYGRLYAVVLEQSETIGKLLAWTARADVTLRDINSKVSELHDRQSDFRRQLQTVPEVVDERIDLDKGHTAQEALAHAAASRRKVVEGVAVAIIVAMAAFIAGHLVK